MKAKIEECTELVVSLLRERHSVNVLLIPELLGERSVIAYQALGWLAREGRVRYSMKGRQCYLSLTEVEPKGTAGTGGG